MSSPRYAGEWTQLSLAASESWVELRPGGHQLTAHVNHQLGARLERLFPGVEPIVWPWERAQEPELQLLRGARRHA